MAATPKTESNKQIVRRLLDDVVTEGNIDLIDDLFAEDVLDHTLMGDTRGREPIKERAESLHAAFSDFSATAEKLVAEGDTVALWAIDQGTHDGEFLGIEPTGRGVEYPATAFFQMEDGKIVERWVQPDLFGLMQQLGVIELPRDPSSRRTMETATSADGTPIAYERTGSGPPIVLVYGNGDILQFWEEGGVRSAFADQYTVHTIERRGRGESGDAAEYKLEREAEDVAAVVEAIDEPVTLLGHSGGALYSLEAALRTDNLRTLILYEPPIQVGDNELDIAEELTEMRALMERDESEQALVQFMRDIAGLPPDEIDALRSAPVWQEMVAAAHTLPRELEGINEYEFEAARFENVIIPTLLLSGSKSPPLYKDATKAVNESLPDSRIAIFEGEQHMAIHTAPDRFINEVITFIEGSS
ncbi:alpha/beta fold hydrolase [Natrinema sp. SYSU A 869]|uniref:alpha/beta fold hydrolase n=1 Tax=Natrinema sp. SYSU A 869 TaxID=2871694 RepID=UPI001CA45FD7|nr:alpha/beta fold hydrolase [Natrinema sp. SYSU A 869]